MPTHTIASHGVALVALIVFATSSMYVPDTLTEAVASGDIALTRVFVR